MSWHRKPRNHQKGEVPCSSIIVMVLFVRCFIQFIMFNNYLTVEKNNNFLYLIKD